MNCDRFEFMLASALGDELTPDDRVAFDNHLATCTRCRGEYDSLRGVTASLRALSAPPSVRIARQRDGVYLEDGAPSRAESSPGRVWRGPLRMAASILLAFVSGYAVHAAVMMRGSATPPTGPIAHLTREPDPNATTLRSALVAAYERSPHQPALANCFAAMFRDSD